MTDTPNPGSDEAVALGCECPRMDNSYGKGYMGQPGVFIYTAFCPVHDPDGKILDQIDEAERSRANQPLPHSEDDA